MWLSDCTMDKRNASLSGIPATGFPYQATKEDPVKYLQSQEQMVSLHRERTWHCCSTSRGGGAAALLQRRDAEWWWHPT